MKDQDLTLRLPHWERALNEFTKASEVIDLPSLYPEIKQNLQDDFKILQITFVFFPLPFFLLPFPLPLPFSSPFCLSLLFPSSPLPLFLPTPHSLLPPSHS